jgi:hypothetical protein
MHERILAMIIAMTVTVPSALLLGLYGETTKEYQERKFSPEPKVTIRLQQLREQLAELRRRTDPLNGQEVGIKIREAEKEIADLEKHLAAR